MYVSGRVRGRKREKQGGRERKREEQGGWKREEEEGRGRKREEEGGRVTPPISKLKLHQLATVTRALFSGEPCFFHIATIINVVVNIGSHGLCTFYYSPQRQYKPSTELYNNA